MKSKNRSQIHFEVHYHGAAAQHTHLHIHQDASGYITASGGAGTIAPGPSGAAARQMAPPLALGYGISPETPLAGQLTRVRDAGSGYGTICARGLAGDSGGVPMEIHAKIFHDLSYPTDRVPEGATSGIIGLDGRYEILNIPNAMHAPMAPHPNNILVIYPVYPISGGGEVRDVLPIPFPGLTATQTECEVGIAPAGMASRPMATVRSAPTFAHDQLGHAFHEYLLHAPVKDGEQWLLQIAYGEFLLSGPRRVTYQSDSLPAEPSWVSRPCPQSAGDWRLVVCQQKDGFRAELTLTGIHEIHFEQPPAWSTDLWNPLGRNHLKPLHDAAGPTLVIEPAPSDQGSQG